MKKSYQLFLGQVEVARDDAVEEFKVSQSFIDSCADYYGTRFEDCLKQVKSAYLSLDFSKINMDESLPTTLAGDPTLEESDDSSEPEPHPKDGIVLAQPTTNALVTSMISSTITQIVEGSLVQDAQDPHLGNDEQPLAPIAQDLLT